MKLFKQFLIAGTALTMSVGIAHADMDNSNKRTAGIEEQAYYFDTNSNDRMDEEEYIVYSYDTIDYNNDDRIDSDEWDSYTTVWYEPVDFDYQNDTFVTYDTDNDGFIERAEYQDAADMKLFTSWDLNNDGYVDVTEYDRVATTYHDVDADGIYEWKTYQ